MTHDSIDGHSSDKRSPDRSRGSVQCCRICHLEAGPERSAHDDEAHLRSLASRDQAETDLSSAGSPTHHPDHEPASHAEHVGSSADREDDHGTEHEDHDAHTDHTGQEQMFRRRFWVSLFLSIPVLFFSAFIQDVFGYTAPTFPGSALIVPVLSVIVFAYGGVPFLSMARTELQHRDPGMMMLISLAITVAFVYSVGSLFIEGTTPFFWELVTLVDVMLLGHWMEMRSVRQASWALDELAKLMPDTAELVAASGDTEEVPVAD